MKKLISLGTGLNTKDGDTLNTISKYINEMSNDLYLRAGWNLNATAKILNEANDIYAHESHILTKKIGNVNYLFVAYMANKTVGTEWVTSGHAYLKVFELSKMELLKTYDLFYPGLTAGITVEAADPLNCPRLLFVGNTLQIVVTSDHALYTRSIDLTDTDYNNWTPGNVSIFQCKMKNASGVTITADLISANIQIHLQNVLGDSYAGYAEMMPIWRNMDRPTLYSGVLYSVMEFSTYHATTDYGEICCLMTSTDNGATWELGKLINYTTSNRTNKILESSLIFIGSQLNIISRTNTNTIKRTYSNDLGNTWITANLTLPTIASKPCVISYTDYAGTKRHVIAVNETSAITENPWRTTLAIYETTDFVTFTELSRIVTNSFAHYPSLEFSNGHIYCSYTTNLKEQLHPTRAVAFDRNSIAVVKIL